VDGGFLKTELFVFLGWCFESMQNKICQVLCFLFCFIRRLMWSGKRNY